jgi:hypothetical protein
MITSRLTDSLTAISASGNNTWSAQFLDPGTGVQDSITNLFVPANTIIIYVGGRPLPAGGEVGYANFGYSWSGSQDWGNTVVGRGKAGATGANPTAFGPWGGSIAFDTNTNWYFGSDTSGLNNTETDFLTVAEHELGHMFGFGTAPSFNDKISNGQFTGSNAVAEFGGNITLDSLQQHWAQGTLDHGLETVMEPVLPAGDRRLFTNLDFAALTDIGWQVTSGSGGTQAYVAAVLNGAGVWGGTSVSSFSQLNGANASIERSNQAGDVAAAFPGYGLFRYEPGTGWRFLTGPSPTLMSIDSAGGIVAEFKGEGVWRFTDAAGWQQLTPADASVLGANADGSFAASFPGNGTYRHEDASGWQFLTGATASILNVDATNGLVAEFPSYGVWRFTDAAGWRQLTSADTSLLAMASNGDFAAEFKGEGVWRWEDASGWRQLTTADASLLSIDLAGDVAGEFAGSGVWRFTDAQNWSLITAGQASNLQMNDAGVLAAEFQGEGLWLYDSTNGWSRLSTLDAALMTIS